MRKLKLVSLLLLLLIGVGQVWAETYTLGWGAASGTEGSYSNFTAVSGSVTNVVSFASDKGSASSAPAYNANSSELRLYYHSGGNGGYITLTPASGVTITGFVMKTSTTPSVKYTVDGGTATDISQTNSTYTATGISASSSLKIQNVNTSNTQLRISTIQITYETSGGGGSTDPILSTIAVATAPTKTTYTAGETFDPAGLVITRTYSNSQSDTYTYANHTNEFSFNPDLDTELATSNTSVTITYGGKTTTQNITVNASTPSSDGGVSDLTFTAACKGSGTADDGAKWTVTSDGTESTYDATKGIHYGTSGAAVQYITLTTNDISGTITKVVVNASAASGVSATVSVTVGGSSFGGNPQSISTTATGYIFTGSASGEIIVTVTKPSSATKAIYCKSVVVTYTSGGGSQQTGVFRKPFKKKLSFRALI